MSCCEFPGAQVHISCEQMTFQLLPGIKVQSRKGVPLPCLGDEMAQMSPGKQN